MTERSGQVTGDGFEEFFHREYPKALAMGRALAPVDGVDLTQEAFVRAFREWDTIKEYDIPGAWVRRVMLRLIADQHRSRNRRNRAVARLGALSGVDRPNHDLVTSDDEAWFSAVRALPRRQAEVIALHYIDQLSIAEVAAILEIATGTVKASLSQARAKLRRSFDARSEGEVER